MKKLLISISFICLISISAHSQEVISSSGDYFENSQGSVSWTIGEPIIETFSAGNVILTQGFQQSKLSAVSIFEIENSDFMISVSPNPTIDNLNLLTNIYENVSYQLFDFNGKLIKEEQLRSEKTIIPFSELSNASYFLNIIKDNKIIKTFQVIKQ